MSSIEVLTNHFPIERVPTGQYFQYEITIEGVGEESKDIPRRHEIVRRMQTVTIPEAFASRAYFDGVKLLYTAKPINLPSLNIRVNMSDRNSPNNNSLKLVRFMKTSGTIIEPRRIASYFQNRATTSDAVVIINLMQLIIRASANEKFVSNGKSYFAEGSARPIGGGLEIWKGFFQSVRPTIGKILINVDTTVAVMVRSGSAIDVALEFLNADNVRALALPPHHPNFRQLEKFFSKIKVTFTHLDKKDGKKPKPKPIKALEPQAGRYSFMHEQSGRQITVSDYYRQHYNLSLRYPDIIGINTTGRNKDHPAIFPLELAMVVPGQFYKKKLTDHAVREVVKVAALRPPERRGLIEKGKAAEGYDNPLKTYSHSEYIHESGMKIGQMLATISGTILNKPKILYGSEHRIDPGNEGQWNTQGHQLHTAKPMDAWGIINFNHRAPSHVMDKNISLLINACGEIGMDVQSPIDVRAGSSADPARDLDLLLQASRARLRKDLQMVIVFLPENAEDIRNAVKHWGDIKTGVLTQCLRDKRKGYNDQYMKNVALKINARLGGYNSLTQSRSLMMLSKSPYMIIGADVSHASPGSTRPSISGLVYSSDMFATKYSALTGVQPPRMEKIMNLDRMVYHCLMSFARQNNALPTNIVFYRDGISEGEFDTVGAAEIQDIKKGIKHALMEPKAKGMAEPKLSFIVVGKRHHVVFFPKGRDYTSDKNGNVQPGFVTTDGLKNPLKPDFYLQSHFAIQGTARSSHYTVLEDNVFGGDLAPLQDLSHSLCYVYAKATRAVSIPAPVYYADLVCARGKFHYPPEFHFETDDGASSAGGSRSLEEWRTGFINTHANMSQMMYFL